MHKSVGSNVKLTINRNGQTKDLNAVLQARPSSIVAQ
jgi:hypothetical protein